MPVPGSSAMLSTVDDAASRLSNKSFQLICRLYLIPATIISLLVPSTHCALLSVARYQIGLYLPFHSHGPQTCLRRIACYNHTHLENIQPYLVDH